MKSNQIARPFGKPTMEYKDANGDNNGNSGNEPEVNAAVLAEIKTLGTNVKGQIEELQRNYKKLQSAVDQGSPDAVKRAEISKLSEDIITRQNALDMTFTKRADDMEVAMQRLMSAGGSHLEGKAGQEFADAKMFLTHQLISQKRLNKTGIDDSMVDVEALRNYSKAFSTYLRIDEKQLPIHSPECVKYLTTGSDPDGGILVTPVTSSRIVERIWEMDPIRQLASVETIGTDALEMLEDLGQFGVDWEGETVATTTVATSQWSKKRIPVHVQSCRPYATQSQVDDASINIEEWIAKKVADKFGRAEANAFVAGNGINKPRGFLTYTDYTGTKGDGGVTMGQIEQRNSGAAAAVTTDGLITLKYSLVEDLLQRGTWLVNRLTVAELMKLKDGDGQYIWRPGITEGQPSTLLGLPLRMSTSMPTITAGALSVALGDWREAYTIVDRQGITVQRDPYTKKPFVEFYTRRRVGGDVVNFQAIKLMVISA